MSQEEKGKQGNGSGVVGTAVSPSQWLQEELRARGLDDALEVLYLSIKDMSPLDKNGVFAISLEAEGQAFELRCAVCASFAGERQLKEWVTQYNGWARAKRLKTVAYGYARELSQVGAWFANAERRITRDFPCLTPSFFVVALRAKESKYFDVLEDAQERIEKHESDPENAPRLTLDGFRSMIHEAPTVDVKSKILKPSPKKLAPAAQGECRNVTTHGDESEDLHVDKKTGRIELWGEPGMKVAAGTIVYAYFDFEEKQEPAIARMTADVHIVSDAEPHAAEIEGDPVAVDTAVEISRGDDQVFCAMARGDGRIIVGIIPVEGFSLLKRPGDDEEEDEDVAPREPAAGSSSAIPEAPAAEAACDERNCYDCASCRKIGLGDESNKQWRLAVVRDREIVFVDETAAAWACGKTRQVISVRTQVFPRAVAIAQACPVFATREEKDAAKKEPVAAETASQEPGTPAEDVGADPAAEATGEPATLEEVMAAAGEGGA
jgi:hypothetical protein